YDASTVAILALAGLSFAMTLSNWIPPYLHRLGMEFNWSMRLGVLLYLFIAVKITVTIYFGADLDAHRAAYLTGVLAVFGFASVTAALDVWHKRKRLGWWKALRLPPLFLLAAAVFAASGALVAWERTLGAVLAAAVIAITRCASLAHAIAAAALDLSSAGPVLEVHFGWSVENPVTANLHFVLFGHGNVPWMVHTLIQRAPVPEERKPRVIVG